VRLHCRYVAAAAMIAPVMALIPVLATNPASASAGPSPARVPVHRVANVSPATISGPVRGGTHGFAFDASALPLDTLGYTEKEYFLSGTATAFKPQQPLTSDGRWKVAPASTAPYRTRLLVRAPADHKKFNGTVIVEWLNVSVGFDTAPDWNASHEHFIREGYAYVGVSAQSVGVNGFPASSGQPNQGMKAWDPKRYASLVHPGDSYSYDIFSQAGAALLRQGAHNPLKGLKIRSLLADGESQSAFRMVTYIDAVAPTAQVFDGYMVHSRGASAAPLSQAPQDVVNAPAPTRFRTDLKVPVLVFESESDVITLGYFSDRQPDSRLFRDWEVAGTSHADHYMLAFDTLDIQKSLPASKPSQCDKPINDGPMRWVLNAAFQALDSWVRDGRPAAHAPRLTVRAGATHTLAVNRYGIAKGGIRTPDVNVPRATLSGLGNTPADFCRIFGTTTPFSAHLLKHLYPTTADYMKKVSRQLRSDVHQKFILPADAAQIVTQAASTKDPSAGV
jgi:hypothetical protein